MSYETRDWQGSWRTYQSAVVPRIQGLDIVDFLDVSTAAEVGGAQHAVTSFDQEMTEAFGQLELGTIETVLMRSEASSSSQIEHLTASAKQLALAELGASRSVNAKLVQANVLAMQGALHRDQPLGTDSIIHMQRDLLGETGLHIGLRAEQVWIGTSGSSPIGADFVPPHHERIAADLTDLWAFLRQPTPLPLAHIAVGHAQFETIHPFVDGNGRVGRALVHRYLRASRLTSHVTVPVSAGLLADAAGYVEALTAYRSGDPQSIIRLFAKASLDAAAVGRELVRELQALRRSWDERIKARRDSAAWRIADGLIGHPAVTSDLGAAAAGVTTVAARAAIAALVEAQVLTKASPGNRNQVWVAEEVTSIYDEVAVLIGRRRTY